MLEATDREDGRDGFAVKLEGYLRRTLHVDVRLVPWEGKGALLLLLVQRYQFYEAAIAGRPCLFMAAKEGFDATPGEIAKHIAMVVFDGLVVLATDGMTAPRRAQLIAQGTPFAVPGAQLYMPQLAMDLREQFQPPARALRDHLSPVAQAVLFHHLLIPALTPPTPTELAPVLHYTPMSIGRAFDEIASRNLATIAWRGREKTLHYKTDRRPTLEMCRTLLRDPARGRHGIQIRSGLPYMLHAGELALAQLTDLSAPRIPTFAIAADGWHDFFKKHGITEVNELGDAEAIIETWRYNPWGLSIGPTVDPLSLYAQYWEHPDERVALAAQELLDTLPW